jgi:hypothetical protein
MKKTHWPERGNKQAGVEQKELAVGWGEGTRENFTFQPHCQSSIPQYHLVSQEVNQYLHFKKPYCEFY